ncbi:major facilitator superfamily MFS_1 [Xylaria bambusicola]|uniref:major facilitator superfamily MFS_1 n=1 Tax=Xylaria bambusicola TaxID=326684 RepID=UPI0020074761|nr:major facilitator superfamily MFS_1 [Xylaria bambusicola]KAI0509027.1 major facilitator superfamily MFS_1 [Xylaria bambusicola]
MGAALDGTVPAEHPDAVEIGSDGEHADQEFHHDWRFYLFACTIPQPFYGQVVEIFGRRVPLLVSVLLFFAGSGIAGGAHNVATLIAGRLVQGLGTGGINVIPKIIICDLVPSRHRGSYFSAMLSTAAIASTIGPILNLPMSGVCAIGVIVLLFILRHVAFLGSVIFIPSMVLLFFGLIMGGTSSYPWRSGRVLAPLVLGVAGWIVFHNRTSAASFALMFIASLTIQAVSYFMPIYFQALKGVSPLTSGVYFLPFALALLPSGGISAAVLAKTSHYKAFHWAGFVLMTVGIGLFSTLDAASSTKEWIGYQITVAWGTGCIFTVSHPSALAALPETMMATATSTFAFIRAFGLMWVTTMSLIIFNGQVQQNLHRVEDSNLHPFLKDGNAYTFASGTIGGQVSIGSLPEPGKSQVLRLYSEALHVVWLVFVAVAGLGFLVVFFLKHIELRKRGETAFGLAGDVQAPSEAQKQVGEI